MPTFVLSYWATIQSTIDAAFESTVLTAVKTANSSTVSCTNWPANCYPYNSTNH